MNKLIPAVCVMALLGGIVARAAQDPSSPPIPAPQKEHEWLRQLVGEWDTEGEATMGPGQPAIKCKGSETGRMVGGFWAMTETRGDFHGTPMTGVMTLGYDPDKQKYVGTWVDSMANYLWRYEGTLDPTGKVLTLDTVGPSPIDPTKKARFKDVIEVKGKDHKVLTSSMEHEGKWITFMTMHAKRKK